MWFRQKLAHYHRDAIVSDYTVWSQNVSPHSSAHLFVVHVLVTLVFPPQLSNVLWFHKPEHFVLFVHPTDEPRIAALLVQAVQKKFPQLHALFFWNAVYSGTKNYLDTCKFCYYIITTDWNSFIMHHIICYWHLSNTTMPICTLVFFTTSYLTKCNLIRPKIIWTP